MEDNKNTQPADNNQNSAVQTPATTGGEKVIQPSPELLQELKVQQVVEPAAVVSPQQQPPQQQPSSPQISPSTNGQMPTGMSASQMGLNNPPENKKKIWLIVPGCLLAVVVLIGVLFVVSKANKSGDPNKPNTWVKYLNSEQGFSAQFVSKPRHQTTSGGDQYLSKTSDNQNEYTVGIAKTTDIKSFIDGEVRALSGGSISTRKSTNVDGQVATDIVFTGNYKGQSETFTQRIIAKNNKLYVAYTIGYGSPAINSDYFIDNFKVQ